jgi:hypothetical protein
MRQYHRAKIITSDEAISQFRAGAAPTLQPAASELERPSYASWSRAS